MSSSLFRNAVVLGLLTAVGPFAIDMYLPALPSIRTSLATDNRAVQASLMAFFIATGLCQLVYGPVSDRIGRKPPLYFGILLYVAGSIGCACAASIEMLIAFRFVQGVGACAGMVVPRAVVRDLHTGVEATRLMSLLMLVFSVSPILAPLTGSLIVALADWRGIFWAIAGVGLLAFTLCATSLVETRPRRSGPAGASGIVASYLNLLFDRRFLGVSFIGAFGVSSFFIYVANSAFVMIEHYGLTPTGYSLAFSVNAAAFIGAAQLNARLVARYGLRNLIRTATVGYAGAMTTLLVLSLTGIDSLAVLMGLMLLGFACLGLVLPTATVLAMEEYGRMAGTASALMGTLQFVTGAAVIAVIGLFANGTALPMVAGIALCSLASFTFAQVTLGAPRRAAEAAAE